MSFENSFPDEIILEICRYLHPTDILLSFGGLNHRLNRTISDFISHVHLSSAISYENYLHLLRVILPRVWSSIETLTIVNSKVSCLTKTFLNNTGETLPLKLKRLNLLYLSISEIYQFITRLTTKSTVEELVVECKDPDFSEQLEVYGFKIAQMLFFRHPTLISVELRGPIVFDLSHLSFLSLSNSEEANSLNMMDSFESSVLRRLTIPLQSLSSLHLLLIYQPYLEYLSVHIGDDKAGYNYTITPFPPLINLREFHFRSEDLSIKYHNIEALLTYFPNLKALSLDVTTDCRSFFDGNILQTLVQSLDSFQFSIARSNPPTLEEETLSTFYTSFWLQTKKWYTQCYWNIDEDGPESDYFHIYSVPYSFTNFDIYKCTNENISTQDKQLLSKKVKRLDFSETSDVNVVPFLKRCPYVHTISLNDVYDDEDNYGTDEEEDITDESDESISMNMFQSSSTNPITLPLLPNIRYIILVALPEHGLGIFERLIQVTPNLQELSIHLDDLRELLRLKEKSLYQTLQKRIYTLEINLDNIWSTQNIRRDIPKILHMFPNMTSLTVLLHPMQKISSVIVQEILVQLLKHETNLVCINIETDSMTTFDLMIKHDGINFLRTWLLLSGNVRFQSESYLHNGMHIELNPSSITIWL